MKLIGFSGKPVDGAHDHTCAGDSPLNIRGDAYVALDDLDHRGVEMRGPCAGAREHPHRRPARDESLHKQRAQPPATASDENHAPCGAT